MKRIGIYVRVSTGPQARDGYSIPEQKERLTAYCRARDWNIVKIYVDAGYTGSNIERPGMENLIADVKEGNIDTVLVYKLDRLSRSQKDTLFLIEDLFLPNNVNFVSMQESFDTSTPFGRAVLSILSVFSQLERELIAERTFMGRTGRAKEGKWHGGPHPIGYDYIDGELVVNQSEAAQVRQVYELYASGVPITAICERMEGKKTKHGDWHHPETVANVLDNPLYVGTIHFDGVQSPNSHTAIVQKDLWETVQHIRSRIGKYPMKESQYLLTGLVFCGNCGSRYFVKKNPNGNKFYCCHSRAKVNRKMIKDPLCKNKNWPIHELERTVFCEINRLADNPNLVRKMEKEPLGGSSESNKSIRNEVDGISSEINRLMDLYQQNDQMIQVGEIAQRIDELYHKKVRLLESVDENRTEKRAFNKERAIVMLKDIQAAKQENNTSDNIKFIRYSLLQLVDRIEVLGEDVHLMWSFAE